ncbi:MAG: hypothetical protein GVY09_02270, partial [Gammaproteobacteria bacterium]|nr:hypothetical protein [Gammaproteobacteria bacterium]
MHPATSFLPASAPAHLRPLPGCRLAAGLLAALLLLPVAAAAVDPDFDDAAIMQIQYPDWFKA